MRKRLPVNFHLWPWCNMHCRFCFSRCLSPPLKSEDRLRVAGILARNFAKVTLAGGEPLLCPDLVDVLRTIRSEGTTTMVVTNGALFIERPDLLDEVAPWCDWIGISVDSSKSSTLRELRRTVDGKAYEPQAYIDVAGRIVEHGVRLKVNTTITRVNADEDMSDLILAMNPERWKVFQMLSITGQNEYSRHDLEVDTGSFRCFVERHRSKVRATG